MSQPKMIAPCRAKSVAMVVPLPHPSPTAPMPVIRTTLFERSKIGIVSCAARTEKESIDGRRLRN